MAPRNAARPGSTRSKCDPRAVGPSRRAQPRRGTELRPTRVALVCPPSLDRRRRTQPMPPSMSSRAELLRARIVFCAGHHDRARQPAPRRSADRRPNPSEHADCPGHERRSRPSPCWRPGPAARCAQLLREVPLRGSASLTWNTTLYGRSASADTMPWPAAASARRSRAWRGRMRDQQRSGCGALPIEVGGMGACRRARWLVRPRQCSQVLSPELAAQDLAHRRLWQLGAGARRSGPLLPVRLVLTSRVSLW